MLAEGISTLVPTSLGFAVGSLRDDAVFFCERIPGNFPRLITGRLPLLEELCFEQIAIVHVADEEIHLVGIRDGCFAAGAVSLAFVELAGECSDVLVGGVTPWSFEVGFGLNFCLQFLPSPSRRSLRETLLSWLPSIVF